MIDGDPRIEARIRQVQALFSKLPRNQEFCPAIVAPSFAESLGVDKKHVLEMLQSPQIKLYPDVPAFIERSFSVGAVPVIWTQGEVGDCDPWSEVYDPSQIGFQPLKIIRSGLIDLLRPWKYVYKHYDLSPIIGGRNKVEPRVLAPMMELARLNGFDSIVGVDDRTDMLKLLEDELEYYPVSNVSLYHINRNDARFEQSPFRRARNLAEVGLRRRSVCLLDFDRTSGDTDRMKEQMVYDLAQL